MLVNQFSRCATANYNTKLKKSNYQLSSELLKTDIFNVNYEKVTF